MSTTAVLFALAAAASGRLITPAELASRLQEPGIVVLHVEDRNGDFAAGHVPGARAVRYTQFAVDGPDGLGSELPPLDVLRAVFETAGVSTVSQVIVYGSAIGATRAFFTLDYLGHPDVRVLNGGLAAWKAEGRPVQVGAGTASTRGSLAALTERPDVVVTADWLIARLGSAAMTLVDARPDAEFTGADGGMGGMHPAGHLAGARQLVWTDLVSRTGQFLADDVMRTRLAAAGATAGRPVVSYCMIGMRASVIYFVARHLGFDARMYDGSIVDWGRRRLPVRPGRQ
ncbi:MAG: rhodanese-like domain-containing protein [Vicinamibacterales bacterium]